MAAVKINYQSFQALRAIQARCFPRGQESCEMAESGGPRRRKPPAYKGGRPCDACRRRKTRCMVETGQQKCNVCLHRQNPCTFNEEPPKRYVGVSLPSDLDNTVVRASPSPQDVLNLVHFSGQGASPAATINSGNAQSGVDATALRSGGAAQNDDRWERSLGLNSHKFAELYGLGSDMEPILMVRLKLSETKVFD